MRVYEDVVEVRGEPAPRQFLWRGRLYVVRDVLSHWYERSAWWDGAQARAARGEEVGEGVGGGAGGEREVWRVEASTGRSAGPGVFDLALTAASQDDGSRAGPAWHLLRVMD